MSRRLPLLKGTLDLLILKTLSLGARHGFGIVQTIEDTTDGVFFVEEGSLYPALHRLQRKGLVTSKWGISELRRRARFYELTKRGRAQLARETADWDLIRESVGKVLALGPEGA